MYDLLIKADVGLFCAVLSERVGYPMLEFYFRPKQVNVLIIDKNGMGIFISLISFECVGVMALPE